MIKGFKEFILRGNVIDLAVAVVIGAAFTAVVTSIVDNLFNPIISALFNAESLNKALPLAIPTVSGGSSTIYFGAIIGAILNFLIIAAVVYFVFVLPINTLKKRADALLAKNKPAGDNEAPLAPTEVELLAEIRDLLAKREV
ncbi:large conductance mechanosensitive channel [Labedella gwakjiensis]|uniref:Large-conductance mechanosensitive channel n=1 Tax=Labedella gwakjiensis TaxID=390269 RepID=A0A2P8GRE6_9MICO|nr:large conductance mechanosensitive channel protein MscL [Labedella gwakjiensis]PSL36515.1 large conductance mechanosensitive channel [Labedella gwakjiensis]RUQ85567.1 large conductance mechanosensitive channel protein MscL [Labedella gwakjiensis]